MLRKLYQFLKMLEPCRYFSDIAVVAHCYSIEPVEDLFCFVK